MRILVVYDVAYPFTQGGGQKRMWEVASRLAIQGNQVDWLCFKTWNDSSSLRNSDGISYIGVDGFRGLYKKNGKRRILEPIEFFFSLLKNKIVLNNYDVVWVGQWPLTHIIYFIFFCKFDRKKIFVDWWEVWGETWVRYSLVAGWVGYLLEKSLLWIICRYANLILISEKAVQFFESAQFICKKSISLIPNGINCAELGAVETRSKIYKLVYFGRLQKHKNVDLLIDAVEYICSHYKFEVNLRIIGDGPEKNRLKNLIKEYLLDDLVEIISDSESDVIFYTLISEALIFVNPSTKEGGGSITTLEGYGLGLPVIGFACKDGIDPSLLEESKGGVLVNTVSVEALGDQIYKLLCDKERIAKLSQNGKLFSKNCDWNQIAMKYADLFAGVGHKL